MFKYNLKCIIMLTILVGFFSFHGKALATSVAVSPTTLELTVAPGEFFETQLEVYGAPDQNLRAKAYLHDYEFDLSGKAILYKEGGILPRSAASWVSIEPQDFIIPAGEKRMVRISGTVPQDTPGGDYWSMYFIEIFPFSQLQTSGVVVSGRVGGSFTITVPGADGPKGKITALEVECFVEEHKQQVSGVITFKNEGDLILKPSGRVEIRTLQNQVLEEIIIRPVKIHPGAERRISFTEQINLEEGRYVALAILDYGGEKLSGFPNIFWVDR